MDDRRNEIIIVSITLVTVIFITCYLIASEVRTRSVPLDASGDATTTVRSTRSTTSKSNNKKPDWMCITGDCMNVREEGYLYCEEHLASDVRAKRKTGNSAEARTRDMSDLDVDAFYEDYHWEYEDEDDAWDELEDNEDEWDDY